MAKLLGKKNIDLILETAKENLIKYDSLFPVLFVQDIKTQKTLVIGLNLYDDTDRQKTFSSIKKKLEKEKIKFDEALFVAESFFKKVEKGEKIDRTKPIKEQRGNKEAIILTGRNRKGNDSLMVMQAFTKTEGKYLFDEKIIERSDKPLHITGLLDYLFDEKEARFKERITASEIDGKQLN
jgi:hypothetical protein